MPLPRIGLALPFGPPLPLPFELLVDSPQPLPVGLRSGAERDTCAYDTAQTQTTSTSTNKALVRMDPPGRKFSGTSLNPTCREVRKWRDGSKESCCSSSDRADIFSMNRDTRLVRAGLA